MKLGGGVRKAGWLALGVAVGLLNGWVLTLLLPEVYTSRAVLRALPSMIPERFAPSLPVLLVETMLPSATQSLTSRNSLANLIHTYDLYEAEQKRLPLEDVMEFMSKQVDIHAAENKIEIAFHYPDAKAAQKVCRQLMTSLIDDTIRQRSSGSKMTVEFLKEQLQDAGRQWEVTVAEPVVAGPRGMRRQLDLDIAKRRYETLSAQVDDAQMATDIETRKQGGTLEVLELPSLPEHPDPIWGMTRELIIGLSGLAGLIVVGIVLWIRREQTRAAPFVEPAPV